MKKRHLSESFMRIWHRFERFTKHQKVFVLYLFALIFFVIVLPLIKIAPVNSASHSIRLFNLHLFKTLIIVLVSLWVLVAWNMSFKFKNFVIGYFGFKENDSLVNFGFLRVIATAMFGMWDTISVVGTSTQTIKVTWSYYFIQVFLLLWLILTLLSIIKHAKENTSKTRIVNVVDEEAIREVHNKQAIKWLFEDGDKEEKEPEHHEHHQEHVAHHQQSLYHNDEEE